MEELSSEPEKICISSQPIHSLDLKQEGKEAASSYAINLRGITDGKVSYPRSIVRAWFKHLRCQPKKTEQSRDTNHCCLQRILLAWRHAISHTDTHRRDLEVVQDLSLVLSRLGDWLALSESRRTLKLLNESYSTNVPKIALTSLLKLPHVLASLSTTQLSQKQFSVSIAALKVRCYHLSRFTSCRAISQCLNLAWSYLNAEAAEELSIKLKMTSRKIWRTFAG